MSDRAERYNSGKLRLAEIYRWLELELLVETALVMELGSKKYSKDNWKKGMPEVEVLNSLLRHARELSLGNKTDAESGRSHYAHIVANAMFGYYYNQEGKGDLL